MTDTWNLSSPPDCSCGRLVREQMKLTDEIEQLQAIERAARKLRDPTRHDQAVSRDELDLALEGHETTKDLRQPSPLETVDSFTSDSTVSESISHPEIDTQPDKDDDN